MSKEINRLLKDANNKRQDELQDRIKNKIVIGTIHAIHTPEFENLIYALGEMNRDNHYEYTITICKQCENCGSINDTVREVTIPERRIQGKTIRDEEKMLLCDYCHANEEF